MLQQLTQATGPIVKLDKNHTNRERYVGPHQDKPIQTFNKSLRKIKKITENRIAIGIITRIIKKCVSNDIFNNIINITDPKKYIKETIISVLVNWLGFCILYPLKDFQLLINQ